METKKDDEPDEVIVDESSFEACGGSSGNQSANDQDDDEEEDVVDDEDEDDDDDDVDTHLPAISPISNVSSSSGFFSCGSASSSSFASKPTTPTNLHLTDKSDDDYHSPINRSTNDRDFGKLPISKKRDNEENNSDNQYNRQTASTSKSVKIRSKHHRQSRKHISLDDEIVIYESDSSLQVASDSRRRTIHMMQKSNFHANQMSKSSASRRRSEESSSSSTHHIVSILKRKDSSTSSNAGLVTFSPNVVDTTETRSRHRTGILKKRSSLDESSRYRSHSPSSASSESEKGCLVKGTHRRNSFEEISHHGILKQKSYDSSGGGSSAICGSSGGYNTPNSCTSSSSSNVQGILKKPSLTPSDHPNDPHQPTKHVSISEAVILAAAELCKDMIILDDNQCESYIKPILKVDNDHHNYQERKPKPILKKNHSSENEEIRSILKSRKSSREESSSQDDL